MSKLSGWGRYPARDTTLLSARDDSAVAEAIAAGPLIARGMGRAYGDAALAPRALAMASRDHFIAFDEAEGILTAEAGLTLGAIIAALLPRGWFPKVTPGTRHVSLGGAIAADVHGKNHHLDGSFRNCTEWFDLMGPDGVIRRCSPLENPELFERSFGAMGLTGVILRAAIRLTKVESAWIRQTTRPAASLAETIEVMEADLAAPYSVAWIDTLARGADMGRALVMSGHHASRAQLPVKYRARPFETPKPLPLKVPFNAPGFLLNAHLMRAFNASYYHLGRRKAGESFVAWQPYFYPLDAVANWNRIYGKRGFVQFQCALPLAASREGLEALLARITEAGAGSFLAVLKRFGPATSQLGFPMEGYTLALDFPATEKNLALMQELDAITLAHGGRFYLAKDARMSRETLTTSDPRFIDFAAWRQAQGLSQAFASDQSQRLGL